MAHNLTPSDLLYPKGELLMALFPDRSLGNTAEDALQIWLDQAQSLILGVAAELQNMAARYYCYARAYRAEAYRLAATPNTSSDSGSPMSTATAWGDDRIAFWQNKARSYEDLFYALGGLGERIALAGYGYPGPIFEVS